MDARAGNAAETAAAGELSRAPRRILAIFNPASGRNRRTRFDEVVAALRARGCAVNVVITERAGHAEAIARGIGDDIDVIAAAGGDGTVNEIVNGLTGKSVALGLIPLGTANVLADEIALPRGVDQLAQILAEGPVRDINLGRCNGRRFVMMAGAGFDANVVDTVSLRLKRAVGPLAYVWQAAVEGFKQRPLACDLLIDGVPYKTASVVACNGRRYGGPFIAAPDAALVDRCFHVVLMTGSRWFDTARYGVALVLGRIGKLSDVKIIPAQEIVVNGIEGRPVQADGDIIARLPATISVDPEPLRLIFPK